MLTKVTGLRLNSLVWVSASLLACTLLSGFTFKSSQLHPPDSYSATSIGCQEFPRLGIDSVTSTKMKAEDIKKAQRITAGTGYTLATTNIYFSGAGFRETVTVAISGNSLLGIKEVLDRCVPGSIVTFDNVKVKDGKDRISTIRGMSIVLY